MLRSGMGFFEPAFDCGHVHAGLLRLAFQFREANARKSDVIHFRCARDTSLVFEMAVSARGDVGVKGARLALEDGLVVRVADDAVLCLDALHRRMTCGAVVCEKSVRLRQLAGEDRVLPGSG